MRLTEREREVIVLLAREFFGDGAVARLFGSRLDDDREGGDIDLHIETKSPASATLMEFTFELKDRIGDVPVDVIVRAPGYWPRGIDQVALGAGVVLWNGK